MKRLPLLRQCLNQWVLMLAITMGASANLQAAVAIRIYAGELRAGNGDHLLPGALLQLVNLGADGQFNQVYNDGTFGPVTQWVSGDDTLVDLPFGGDFPSAAAFDLSDGAGLGPGIMDRTFVFDSLPAGTKLGLRWWPQYQAADFANITLSGYQGLIGFGEGEFTRQSNAQHGGDLWVVPAIDTIVFDSLATASIGGNDPNMAGSAEAVPEPASILFGAIGAGMLLSRRRKRTE